MAGGGEPGTRDREKKGEQSEKKKRSESRRWEILSRTRRQSSYRWPGTPLWWYVPPPLSYLSHPLKPLVHLAAPRQWPPLWPLPPPRCLQPGRYKLLSPPDALQATGEKSWQLYSIFDILNCGNEYYLCNVFISHLYGVDILCLLGYQLQGGALAFPGQRGPWPACGATLHRDRFTHSDSQGPDRCQPHLRSI